MIRTIEDLIDDLKFVTGQDSLTNARAVKLFNYAKDNYSYIALTASGRWKFDDYTHENEDGDPTSPIASSTLQPNEESLPLETTFLALNQVQIFVNGQWEVLQPIDTRDRKDNVLSSIYKTNGKPQFYDYDAHSIYFYPKSDSSIPVRVLYSRAGKHFDSVDLTQQTGIPSIHDEYLVMYAGDKLSFRTVDGARVDFKNELFKWEGDGVSGGKIRDFYSKRDQDTPRRLKGMTPPVFTGSARGKGRRGSNGISGRI
jgi:hypothetical protein